MNTNPWAAVDDYIAGMFIGPDPVLDAALSDSAAAGLPAIHVSASQGKLLQLIALCCGARNILEIGTLGAYSTIWLARGLAPGGRLVTLEAEPRHAAVARANLARAGLSEQVEVREGRACDTLPQLAAEGRGPFDLVFIDADKPGYAEYFSWSMRLTCPGSLIVADNVVRKGAVSDPSSTDPNVLGVRRMNELVRAEPRVTATVLQTVGSKGYDGMMLARVKAASSPGG